MTGPDDNRTPGLARFSYMWRLINGKWKIIHHHSSEVRGKNVKVEVEVDLYPVAQENFKLWNDALK
ncbi:nuclear transport factor 2 family protein, partial [Staphylococcus nepalensis]|uniref:nuclear transport factor 2 family protein n=1 Tax=Staphylococcus nepalensis TaxID=214473 RepID=UPI00286DDA93